VREDKPPREVVREMPVTTDRSGGNRAAGSREGAASHPAQAAQATGTTAKVKSTVKAKGKSATRGKAKAKEKATATVSASAREAKSGNESAVRFTNPDRVYWADAGVTKQDLADYYRAAWPWMAPHVVDRPLALVRCPEGTKGECFFQKHASAGLDDKYLKTVIDKNRRQIIAVEDIDGLLSLVQAGVLEVHVRGSRIARLDVCDRIVFDIDPGEGVTWAAVVAAARDVRERLAAIGLASFVKLTGGKGLHVVLPIEGADWDAAKSFAQAVALAMNANAPERYVTKMTKSLRAGKIFVDYFRNSLEQTSVAAYSTRARTGAPVSVPVTWEELPRSKGGNHYTVRNLARRLAKLEQDPWKDLERVRQKLPDLRKLRAR
jgi:bifunctional non-homologous end joining protein LigD